jgi:hypothetical protein
MVTFKNTVFCIIILSLTGCLSTTDDSSYSSSSPAEYSASSSPNLVHNLLAYKEISLKKELKKYDNIKSIKIEDINSPNSVFISGDSVYKNQVVKFNASSDTVKVQLNLADGSSISLIKR